MRVLICAALGACALYSIASAAPAGGNLPVDVVTIDFPKLIDAAAASNSQFALSIPHPVSAATIIDDLPGGRMSLENNAVKIPTAVSLSFHAVGLTLPGDATLSVSSGSNISIYRARDLKYGELWSALRRRLVGNHA